MLEGLNIPRPLIYGDKFERSFPGNAGITHVNPTGGAGYTIRYRDGSEERVSIWELEKRGWVVPAKRERHR